MMVFVLIQIAEAENQEVDSKFRALVAIGSLVSFHSLYLLWSCVSSELIPDEHSIVLKNHRIRA